MDRPYIICHMTISIDVKVTWRRNAERPQRLCMWTGSQ